MLQELIDLTTIIVVAVVVASLAGWLILRGIRRALRSAPQTTELRLITERVRAVGKLVGLEVHAKEIATATRGWSWVPPGLLSQAKVAMIFEFEKQYAVELASLGPDAVRKSREGSYRLTLPTVHGTLRLVSVQPYDIQTGRLLGLIDVISMNAERQGELMALAQSQAAELFEKSEDKYKAQARDAIERQVHSLLGLVDVEIEIEWARRESDASEGRLVVERSEGSGERELTPMTGARSS